MDTTTTTNRTLRACPLCRAWWPREARFCGTCGQPLPAAPPLPAAAPVALPALRTLRRNIAKTALLAFALAVPSVPLAVWGGGHAIEAHGRAEAEAIYQAAQARKAAQPPEAPQAEAAPSPVIAEPEWRSCPYCSGTGTALKLLTSGGAIEVPCRDCGGTGRIVDHRSELYLNQTINHMHGIESGPSTFSP